MEVSRQKFMKQRNRRTFRNCIHNRRCCARGGIDFDYCELKTQTKNGLLQKLFICNKDSWVEQCSEFTNQPEEEISAEFHRIVSDPSSCGRHFPHLATLLWVLHEDRPEYVTSPPVNTDTDKKEDRKEDSKEEGWVTKTLRRILPG